MSQPWKLLPLAAVLAVIGALLLAPGGVTRPDSASAAIDCDADPGIIQVQIRDLDDGGNPVEQAGITVRISPDPQDDSDGSRDYVDNGTNDDSNTVGTVRENAACVADDNDYTASIVDFPESYECDVLVNDATFGVSTDDVSAVELFVGNCEAEATATPTSTAGPAAEINLSAAPSTISCSGTSIVTIEVLDDEGEPVPVGTEVEITTSLGTISPSSGQTTDQTAKAFVFLTAPASEGGTATVTAESGDAEGTTTVTINCGATPVPTGTTAPPPTVSPGGGVISPPNTGSAGLADTTGGSSWLAIAGFGLLVATALGAVSAVRVRA